MVLRKIRFIVDLGNYNMPLWHTASAESLGDDDGEPEIQRDDKDPGEILEDDEDHRRHLRHVAVPPEPWQTLDPQKAQQTSKSWRALYKSPRVLIFSPRSWRLGVRQS